MNIIETLHVPVKNFIRMVLYLGSDLIQLGIGHLDLTPNVQRQFPAQMCFGSTHEIFILCVDI